MKKILIVTLSLLALVPGYSVDKALVSTKGNSTSRLMIGILRADGTLVPFAQYGNGGWWNPWPKPRLVAESIYAESSDSLEHSLADLSEPWFKQCGELPISWFFWSSAGTPTELSASRLVQVRAHSGTNWGLLTDLPKRTSTDPLHDVIGVAVTVRQKIEPITKIEPASTQGKEISSFIRQIFDVEETAEIDRMREGTPLSANLSPIAFSLSSEERAKVETSLTVLYRSSSVANGEHVYYFEAEKQYQKRITSGGLGCNDVSLFQGWIAGDVRDGFGLMAGNLVFTDCDRKGPSTMIPLGIMTLKDQVFLFVREHGWEDESYTILELHQSGLRRVLQTVGA